MHWSYIMLRLALSRYPAPCILDSEVAQITLAVRINQQYPQICIFNLLSKQHTNKSMWKGAPGLVIAGFRLA